MNLTEITKIVTLVLAISVAGERLVTFLKTLVPWLAAPQTPTQQPDSGSEIARKVILMIVAFLCCWLTAVLAPHTDSTKNTIFTDPFIGLLASGGSAFWTNILSYLKGIANVKQQQGVQEKINSSNLLANSSSDTLNQRAEGVQQRMMLSPQPEFGSVSQKNVKP